MNRDQLIREARNNAGTWPALVGLYGLIVGVMLVSAAAIL